MYDDTQLRLGISCIAAAFAKTIQKRDPEFGLDFVHQLEAVYRELREMEGDNTGSHGNGPVGRQRHGEAVVLRLKRQRPAEASP